MRNTSIKDLIVSLSGPLHSTAQPAQLVTFTTTMYFLNLSALVQ